MARVLFCWELGAGSGHVSRHYHLIKQLRESGHDVYFALRNVTAGRQLYEDLGVLPIAAPYQALPNDSTGKPTYTYPQLLQQVGYDTPGNLVLLLEAWRALFHALRPDLLIADHSPTALLAARGLPLCKVAMGTGFSVPPDLEYFPNLTSKPQDETWLRGIQAQVTKVVNEALFRLGLPELPRLGALFREVDERILTTPRELDHYGDRSDSALWGLGPFTGDLCPSWPLSENRRIFAYLKVAPTLRTTLKLLQELGLPSLVALDGVPEALTAEFAGSLLHFCSAAVDLGYVAKTCDSAILNATHGTTAALLMRGVPVLMIPLNLEQDVLARRATSLGLGVMASAGSDREVLEKFSQLLNEDRFKRTAMAFAGIYAAYDPWMTLATWHTRLLSLLP